MRLVTGVVSAVALAGVVCGAAYGAASAAAPFPVEQFEIDVGQQEIAGVAPYPDGSRAIVMFYGGPVRLLLIDANKGQVIDGPEGEFDQRILPSGGAVVGRRLYVACYYGLFDIDLESKVVTKIYAPEPYQGGTGVSSVVVSSTMRRVYAIAAHRLLAVDTKNRKVVAIVPVEKEHQYSIAISRDDREIYLADGTTGSLQRFEATDLKPLGASSYVLDKEQRNQPPGIAAGPDGSIDIGYTDISGRYTLSVFERTGALVRTKDFVWAATGLAMTPDGAYLVTGNGEVLDRKTLTLVAHVRGALNSGDIQITRDGLRAFSARGATPLVTVTDLTTIPRLVKIDIRSAGVELPPDPKDLPVIPVAILSARDFDATSVVPQSVCFGPSPQEERGVCGEAAVLGANRDLDGDGSVDLLLGFRQSLTELEMSAPEACLTGKTASGGRIGGCDIVIKERGPGPGIGAGVASPHPRTSPHPPEPQPPTAPPSPVQSPPHDRRFWGQNG